MAKPTRFPNGLRAPLLNSSGAQPSAITDITDNSGGTGAAGGTLAAVTGIYNETVIENNFAVIAAQLTAINAALQAAQVTAS